MSADGLGDADAYTELADPVPEDALIGTAVHHLVFMPA